MGSQGSAGVRLVAIDGDLSHLNLVFRSLAGMDLKVLTAATPQEGLDLVRREKPELVLREPELLDEVLDGDPGIAAVIMAGQYSTEAAIEAIRKGAYDYLRKPVAPDGLRRTIERWVLEAHERRQTLRLDLELVEAFQFEGLVGRSPLMLDVFSRIRRAAPHFRTVLLRGETGTGKELAARALHRLSPVASGPFVVCNASAVVETLFESELFGYVRGAFTGANQNKVGMAEFANGGTLFLDEIGEIPLSAQAKLLRLLQNEEVQPVGSPRARRVDVRVIAATNRELRALALQKKFRDDLYYRLSMVEIVLPPLAARMEDLPLLQRFFLERFSAKFAKPVRGITRRAQALLARYNWPGNVRELENVLGYCCMMLESDRIDIRDLPENLRAQAHRPRAESEELLPLAEVERRYALRVLEHVQGNRSRAAEILGISRATLYRLLRAAPERPEIRLISRA